MAKFRKLEIRVSKLSGYGQYQVEALYKGVRVRAITSNSEIYDWLEDSSNREKHQDAKRAAYGMIVRAYNS